MSKRAVAQKPRSRPPAPPPPPKLVQAPPPAAAADFGRVTNGGLFIPDDHLLRFLPPGAPRDPKQARRELRMLVADMRDATPIYGPTDWPKQFDDGTMRIATSDDRDAIHDLLTIDLEENAKRIAPINHDRVDSILDACLVMESGPTAPMGSVCAVAENVNGLIVGTVALFPVQWWWSQQWYLQEVFCYVHPDHRRSGHAAALIQFAKAWTDKMTDGFGFRVYLIMGILGLTKVRETARLYRRHMNPCGEAFVYPLPPDVEGER